MKKITGIIFIVICLSLIILGFKKQTILPVKPNIILILLDDIGYEIPHYTGGQSYNTPNLNWLAANGVQFTRCNAMPLCSPSRFEIMTGKYNFRNYPDWGKMGLEQKTFANLLHDNGYKTFIGGKWQLNNGAVAMQTFGFDDYIISQPFANFDTTEAGKGTYKNPQLYSNGIYLPDSNTAGKYGEDIIRDSLFSFIDSNKNTPFFAYWTIHLCHEPFEPTPDNSAFATWTDTSASDTAYFPSMVKYMDKEIGQLIDKIINENIPNTIVIVTGDNGTPIQIYSKWNGTIIRGGKNTSTIYGTHVPLIAWGTGITPKVDSGLIDFTDFMPTLAELSGSVIPNSWGIMDGLSFAPRIGGKNQPLRKWLFFDWQPYPITQANRHDRWVQNATYKKYDTITSIPRKKGAFYNIKANPLETGYGTLPQNETPAQQVFDSTFRDVMSKMHN